MIRYFTQSNPRLHKMVIVVALMVLAVLPYVQTLQHDFVDYDDMMYVYENEIVLRGLTWEGLGYAFTTIEGGNWHPLTWLAHMMDCAIFERADGSQWAGGHHAMSVALHAANAVLVLIVMYTLTGRRHLWQAALVAALFAAHPLRVESVAWVSERKDVLSTLFGLLALWSYVKFVRNRTVIGMGCTSFFLLLSLLTKPMLVTLPFLLLLLDIWPLRRVRCTDIASGVPSSDVGAVSWFAALLEKAPLFVLSVFFSIVAVVSQHASHTTAPVDLLSIGARLSNAVVAYQAYLVKTIVPVNLAVFYPHPVKWDGMAVAASALIMISMTTIAFWQRRERPWLLIGWLWFLGLLVPVIGLVQVGYQFMADRYSYLPSIGLFILVVWMIPTFTYKMARVFTCIVCAAIVALLTWLAFLQTAHWKDSRTLFTHALTVTTGNYVAHHNLGRALEREGDREAALDQYALAARIRPRNPKTWLNIGHTLIELGRFEEAVHPLQVAYELDKASTEACNSMGVVLMALNQPHEAVQWLHRSVDLDTTNIDARGNLGSVLFQLGRADEAVPHLHIVAVSKPERIIVRTTLAAALIQVGRTEDARRELHSILESNPNHAPAHTLLESLDDHAKQQPIP